MRGRSVPLFAVSLLVAATVLAQSSGRAKATDAPKAAAGKAVVVPAREVKWEDVPNGPAGVRQAHLWGDPTQGPFSALHRFPPGFVAPLHTHTADLRIVVVSGTLIHGPEGKTGVRLPPGSYLTLPPTDRHTSACDKASECIFFIEGNRRFDVRWVEEAKAPKKK